MRIEFDKAKDRRNRAKHGLSLGLAAKLDWDSMLLQVDDREDYGEERLIGIAPQGGRLYTAVFTMRDDETLRIISLRGRQTLRLNAMKHKATSKRKYRLNTPAEEARIQAGIKADPDTRELTVRELSRMRPFGEMIKRGRPKSAVLKEPVTVRLDPEVLGFFRASGRGWQTRMNKALAEYVSKQRRARP